MPNVLEMNIAGTLEQLQAQIAQLTKRLADMEKRDEVTEPPVAHAPVEPPPVTITEEELLAISAAIGAFLGVRAHIRQIRLISTNAWAQQGRVSIQASHRLQ